MMLVNEIKLFELLKAKIGEREAEAFVEILDTRVDAKFEDAKATLATKDDINNLLKWIIIMWITQLGAIVTIIKFMMH